MQRQLFDGALKHNDLQNDGDEVACWQAVLERDANSDGRFVYGVRSTGIYCRPSCPSRRPHRHNVAFYAGAEAARGAGLRACKRCRPDGELTPQIERVREACRLLEADCETPLSLSALSQKVGSSPHHLQRTFKQVTGVSPKAYSDALRLKRLKTTLQKGESVLNARLAAGYNSQRGVYEHADSGLGMTPAIYGRGGKGAHVFFDIKPCPLGFLLVAATQKGVCSVALGDSREGLEAALHQEFGAAKIERDSKFVQNQMQLLLRYLEGREAHLDLPLDVQATAFQGRVWQLLKSIEPGQTRSYRQVAEMLNAPTASRAVARACATNPVALIIPCHRVVRGDGALAGYRWGLERKKKLLAQERESTTK